MNKPGERKFWYTNGITEIQVGEQSAPPEGFHRGRNPKMSTLMSQRRADGSIPTWNKGIPASDEQKEKQRVAMSGREPWNKGLTKETDDRVKQTATKLTGHPCFVTDWEIAKQKEYITKKAHGTFNTSKPEEEFYKELCTQYGAENVEYQYREARYPFKCDFYVKTLDLFIELNYTWEHGPHPFNEEDPKDLELLSLWQMRSTDGKSRYLYAIKQWTEIDPQKLECFRKNKLNFQIIYKEVTITK